MRRLSRRIKRRGMGRRYSSGCARSSGSRGSITTASTNRASIPDFEKRREWKHDLAVESRTENYRIRSRLQICREWHWEPLSFAKTQEPLEFPEKRLELNDI